MSIDIFLIGYTKLNKHMEKCLMSWIIREMQIKTAVRYHFLPIRITIIENNSDNNNCWLWYGENGTFVHYCGNKNQLASMTIVFYFLKKLKIQLQYYKGIPILSIHKK
jgi:hypothetical protein